MDYRTTRTIYAYSINLINKIMKSENIIIKSAIGTGIANTIINGFITWFTFKGMESVPFSVDKISNNEVTVFGSIFPVIIGLTLILGIITYFTFKKTAVKENLAPLAVINKPFYPHILKFIFGRMFSAIGLIMIIAVFWQRILGTIHVNAISATVIVGIAAGLSSAFIAYTVSKEILRDK